MDPNHCPIPWHLPQQRHGSGGIDQPGSPDLSKIKIMWCIHRHASLTLTAELVMTQLPRDYIFRCQASSAHFHLNPYKSCKQLSLISRVHWKQTICWLFDWFGFPTVVFKLTQIAVQLAVSSIFLSFPNFLFSWNSIGWSLILSSLRSLNIHIWKGQLTEFSWIPLDLQERINFMSRPKQKCSSLVCHIFMQVSQGRNIKTWSINESEFSLFSDFRASRNNGLLMLESSACL